MPFGILYCENQHHDVPLSRAHHPITNTTTITLPFVWCLTGVDTIVVECWNFTVTERPALEVNESEWDDAIVSSGLIYGSVQGVSKITLSQSYQIPGMVEFDRMLVE